MQLVLRKMKVELKNVRARMVVKSAAACYNSLPTGAYVIIWNDLQADYQIVTEGHVVKTT
jgi:hypothetical protein